MPIELDRRSFLIGGSVAATATLASFYAAQFNTLGRLALPEPPVHDRVLYADESQDFLLSFDYTLNEAVEIKPYIDNITWTDYLVRQGEIDDPTNLKLSDFRSAYQKHDLLPRQLDESVGHHTHEELWNFEDGPFAKTYFHLKNLGLLVDGPNTTTTYNPVSTIQGDGVLCFYYEHIHGRSVHCNSLISVALLQERLIELGKPIKVELVYEGL